MRDRRAAIASDIEPRPGDEVEKAKPRLDAACRHAIDQQRELAETRPCGHGRLGLARQTAHTYAEPMLASRYRRLRSHDHMLASDIHVVHEMTGLHIQAVAAGRIAMGYQDTFARFADVNVGLDQIAAAADIGCDIRRQVPHSGMEHVALAGAVKAVGILDEALTKAVVERQHMVFLCLLPPELHQCCKLFRLLGCEVIRFREVLVEMEQLPFVILVGCARGMKCDGLPACVP